MIKYVVGIFPLLALASIELGNPYFSMILIPFACIFAIPTCFIAIRSLAKGKDPVWAIFSLVCGSTAAIFGVLGIGILISETI
ncbi:hypothetical protein [Thalassolituus oleivorans]|uniref:hypothetical protein n=1 Tax=Thalassolituus oleivorans TaxID=187493 RepID=UPI002409D5E2|nr:hypothetical protein [Thalassolituus oleivorans]MDF1640283.1 hypothetical protein [Thalassolituus oleivorans]